ncbi:MAG: ribosome maturation factor RimM [Clostridiales Family XIII bacterium]|jgi:16S rRNA processing protein RimM|nr:ribosome maturation factor RimM [Clostridiales Family XIII bacterium]
MNKIKIGRIAGAQGLRGEVKLYHDSSDDEAIGRLTTLFLLHDGTETAFRIAGLRMQRRTPILKLEGIDDRSAAEGFVGDEVCADLDEARPTEADAWLVSELVGLAVFTEDGGEARGSVSSIIANPAHDIIEIETEKGKALLPFIDAFVSSVNPEAGRILITPPKGWDE